MNWPDELWKITPGTPTTGAANALSVKEREVLLALALGAEFPEAAKITGESESAFQNATMRRIRTKMHAFAVTRLITEGYRTGALALVYKDGAGVPQGARELIPERALKVWLLVLEGHDNGEIAEMLGWTMGQVRSQIKRLGDVLGVAPRMGGRYQLVSRAFEFGIVEGDFSKKK